MRRRPKQDRNAKELIQAMRALGWYWLDLSGLGGGCPDGAAVRGGRIVFCEIKPRETPKRLTPAQVKLQAALKAKSVTVELLTCVEDLQVLGRNASGRYDDGGR